MKPNGSKYDGPWKDDKKHGIGFEHENGKIRKVEYSEDQFIRVVDPSNEQDDSTKNGN